MSTKKITGTGIIATTDYHEVKWVGKTKKGNAVTITLKNAINLGTIDWTMVDKDDVVAEAVFTGTQTNIADTAEPWEITYTDGFTDTEGKDEIILGAGVLSIDSIAIGVSRGGGKFTREPEFREMQFDGARGPVKDGILIDSVRATLTMNVLQILTKMTDLYPGLAETTVV